MRIKVLVNFKDRRVDYTSGDGPLTVSDENGAYFCGNGWAEDVDGKVETGTIDLNVARLDIRDVKNGIISENVGG